MQVRKPEWADHLVTSINRAQSHVPLAAYPDLRSARKGQRFASKNILLLNGNWNFQLTNSPEQMPDDFLSKELETDNWRELKVPSNWQLDPDVDDPPIYTNRAYPFKPQEPPAPPEVNPTGWYRTTFRPPKQWKQRQISLILESCDSACKVWLNGKQVGYGQDSKLPHEFDLTEAVHGGTNHLAVMVPRYCDGFWLECQDYWHLSGIQRDVMLLARPKGHIRDYAVRTTFDSQYVNATLEVDVFLNRPADLHKGYMVELRLYDQNGNEAIEKPVRQEVQLRSPMYGNTEPEAGAAKFRLEIPSPQKWTAETPYLYTLVLVLKGPDGKRRQYESSRIGFRQVEIRDRQLMLNGRRLIIRGVNVHEHHPDKGRALTVDDMRAELIAMKQLNFNAVRTSHYPHHTAFYELCDELGLYVVDEANLETHGLQAELTKDPTWLQAYMERAQRLAMRDKNHPSVIIWSLGNESSYGPHHAAMAAWLRHYDPSRPVQYESGNPPPTITDLMVPMYAPLDWVGKVMADATEQRPMIQCEYAYSKGNANGNVDKFWDLVDTWPSYQGGFVWDWRDKALVREVDGEPQWAYGNEFDGGTGPDGFAYGQHENPQMCLNGVVFPDLIPKPGAVELMKVQAPVGFLATDNEAILKGDITIWNKYHTQTLDHLEIAWELTENGEVVTGNSLVPPAIGPDQKATLHLPIKLPHKPKPGAEYWLNLAACYTQDTPWCQAGHIIAWEQFRLPIDAPVPRPQRQPGPKVTCTTEGARITIAGKDFNAIFDQRRGALLAYKVGDRDLLTRPLEHCFMRARTDNDYMVGLQGSYYEDWCKAGLDRLQSHTLECEGTSLSDDRAIVRCITELKAKDVEHGFVCESIYTIFSDGEVLVENEIKADPSLPLLPRVGMRIGLDEGLEQLTWYGCGPHESYPDRKKSALVGCYESTVDAQFTPFIDPCETGGHQNTRWLRLSDDKGHAVQVVGQPMLHFSALHFTLEELIQADHIYKLRRTKDVQLHLDGFHMGLGGDTGWSRNVHEEYLLPPSTYRYAFRLKGFSEPPDGSSGS